MQFFEIKKKQDFIGRCEEMQRLKEIAAQENANILVVYGRRRVGKTELLEQTFRQKNILKFEGIEGLSEKEQLHNVQSQLTRYTGNTLIAKAKIESWTDFFLLLSEHIATKKTIIYLEELQWLANYNDRLISELKYVWDNNLRHHKNLLIILCSSSPSFMIQKVLHSKSLYNRSQYEMHLQEFTVQEAQLFLKNRSQKEVFDAYLSVGGMPEYLKLVNTQSSVFISLCKNSFTLGGFFSTEYKRIFTSSMSNNKFYKKIISYLAKKKFATRKELLTHLKAKSGGTLTNILVDLEKSGFVGKYIPFNANENSLLERYYIKDHYLQFYYKFIASKQNQITNGAYNDYISAINIGDYHKWLGFAFERWCRNNAHVIANILGFHGVAYKSGAFFSRNTSAQDPSYQIDLVFERADNVYIICEIKYYQDVVDTNIIEEFERKLRLFPNKKGKTIQKILICTYGASQALINRGYFDHIITLETFFDSKYS